MKSGVIIAAVIAVLLVVGGVFALSRNPSNKTNPTPTPTDTTQTTQSSNESAQAPATQQPTTNTENVGANTISYTDSGFNPATLTVKSGTTITIKNDSSHVLQFDSNPHPDHTDDPELNVGAISPGQSKTVTVTKTGSHGYHNHLNPSDTGTLVVQ